MAQSLQYLPSRTHSCRVRERDHELYPSQLPFPGCVHKDREEVDITMHQPTVIGQEIKSFLHKKKHSRLITASHIPPLPSHQYLMETPCSGELRLAIRSGAVFLQRGHSLCHYTHLVGKLGREGGGVEDVDKVALKKAP